MVFKLSLLLGAISLWVTVTGSCSSSGVFLTDPTDCKKFRIFDSNKIYHFSCPSNLYFDHRSCSCQYEIPNEAPDGYCDHPQLQFYFKSHFCDCSKYVICNAGTSEIGNCTSGYHFNRLLSKMNLRNGVSVCTEGDCMR